MLTVYLDNADNRQRNCFYESLQGDGWVKMQDVETSWVKDYSDTHSLFINNKVRMSLRNAAESGNVAYRATFLIGELGMDIEYVNSGKNCELAETV